MGHVTRDPFLFNAYEHWRVRDGSIVPAFTSFACDKREHLWDHNGISVRLLYYIYECIHLTKQKSRCHSDKCEYISIGHIYVYRRYPTHHPWPMDVIENHIYLHWNLCINKCIYYLMTSEFIQLTWNYYLNG